jgi:hypothetical protein
VVVLATLGLLLAVSSGDEPIAERLERPERHSLEEALVVAPGATCLEAERLVKHVSWIGEDQVDARLAVTVTGGSIRSHRVELQVRRDGADLARRPIEAEGQDVLVNNAGSLSMTRDRTLPRREARSPASSWR